MKIQVNDSIGVNDKLGTYKAWLGKLIHFFMVKLLPVPRN